MKVGEEYDLEPCKITDENGYLSVELPDGSKYLHRIVVFTFGDKNGKPYSNDLEIDHVDTNRYNNSVGNLELVDRIENLARAFKYKLNGFFSGYEKLISYFENNPDEFKRFNSLIQNYTSNKSIN